MDREAARFFHYTLGAWLRESVTIRGRVLQHYIEHGMREAYAAEQTKAAFAREGSPPNGVSDFFQYRQGGGTA